MTFHEGAHVRAAAAAQVFVSDLGSLELDQSDEHHLFKVRRLRDGEQVVAVGTEGDWCLCEVADGQLRAVSEIRHEVPNVPLVTVAFAPVKGDRSEWAVAKLTELGCDRIVALSTDRAAVRWNRSSADRALERWRRVAREACGQSRRIRPPQIDGPLSVSDFAATSGVALAVPGGPPLTTGISTVLVGPEGGWSEAELSRGIATVGLAGNVLRTETAAVSAGVFLEGLRAGTVGLVENGGGA